MGRDMDKDENTRAEEPILPAAIGEDGLIQPRDDRDAAAPQPSGRDPADGTDEDGPDAHDLAHGNDLKTP